MDKRCKKEDCYNNAEIKGYCLRHFISLPKCKNPGCRNITLIKQGLCKKHYNLDVKGKKEKKLPKEWPLKNKLSVSEKVLGLKKEKSPIKKKKIKYPTSWNNITLEEKKLFIKEEKESKLIIYILKKDSGIDVKSACKKRLLELGCDIPDDLTYRCKISNCNRAPNALNHYTKGFCHYHYKRYLKGIIDFEGKPIRDLVDVKKHNKIFSPEKTVLSQFNKLIRGIHAIRKEMEGIGNLSFEMKDRYEFFVQIKYIEDSLKFIYSPHFILKNTSFLKNVTLKNILGNNKEPAQVILKLDDKSYRGELIQGDESKVFITDKINNNGSVVLFLRGIDKLLEYPFECKAYDKDSNKVQSIRIEEIDGKE